MRTRVVLAVLIVLGLAAIPATVRSDEPEAGATEPSLVENLMGVWAGEGTLFGSAAVFSMHWEWTLDHKFMRLTFENRIPRAKGDDFVLQAQAFYRPQGNDRYEGTWFDSRGLVLPLTAAAEDSALVTLWGSLNTEQGRTVYRMVNRDSVEVEDFVLKNGAWKIFGKAGYGRAAAR